MRSTNSGGWKGSYCTQDNICTGPVVDFVENMLDTYAGDKILHGSCYKGMPKETYEAMVPQEVIDDIYRKNPDEDEFDPDDICLYATGMGYMDICVQAFSMTDERQMVSDMIHVYSDPVILVAPFKKQEPLLWESMFACLSPFSYGCWAIIFGFSRCCCGRFARA
jgi:hypothetical protein